METRPEIVDRLAQLTLFADLNRPQVEAVAHTFEEEVFGEGQRVLRQGLSGSAFYVILDGEASVQVDGIERARLGRGDYFGEISVLTGAAPNADIVAVTLLRCLVVPGPELKQFLLEQPQVMLRVLQAEAQRVRTATAWQS
jgi:CRP/FNR family transcriptional regulator, cyclic AMP receptor protein